MWKETTVRPPTGASAAVSDFACASTKYGATLVSMCEAPMAATSREYQCCVAGLFSRRKPPPVSLMRSKPSTWTMPAGVPAPMPSRFGTKPRLTSTVLPSARRMGVTSQ